MAVPYLIPRGTRAALNAKASGNTIVAGQLYLITDEGRVAVGTSTSSYQALPKQIEDGAHTFTQTATPATPTTGINVYRRAMAGRALIGQVDNLGDTLLYQPNIGRNKVAQWNPAPGTTTVPAIQGFQTFTQLGTATARTPATTSMATRAARLGFTTAATAGLFAGMYSPIAPYTTGAGNGLGGFDVIIRFSVADAISAAGARMFIGLGASTAAPTNVEPTTLANHFGVGMLAGSTNLQMIIGGSSTAAVDLGTSFPGNTNSADMYEVRLYSASMGSTVVGYRVERLNTGAVAENAAVTGTAGTNFPGNTTLLAPRMWRTNNASATALGLDIVSIYAETDN